MSELISKESFKVIEVSPVTSSLIVAEHFGKQNHHLAREILSLVAQKPELEASRNFAQWSEEVEIGSGAKRTVICYWMDRKGFSILAMGFTGAKALDFKCAFYDEFERMEKQLHPQCPAQAQLPAPTLTEQQSFQILSEVAKRCKRNGVHYQTLYRSLKKRYQVTKYTHILQRDFEDALKFIRTVDLRTPVVPEQQSEEPPAQDQKIIASPEFCEALRRFVYEQRYLFPECFEKFYRFLQLVNSPLAGRFYEAYTSINLASLEHSLASVGYPVDELVNYKRTPKPIAVISR